MNLRKDHYRFRPGPRGRPLPGHRRSFSLCLARGGLGRDSRPSPVPPLASPGSPDPLRPVRGPRPASPAPTLATTAFAAARGEGKLPRPPGPASLRVPARPALSSSGGGAGGLKSTLPHAGEGAPGGLRSRFEKRPNSVRDVCPKSSSRSAGGEMLKNKKQRADNS